MLPLALFLLPSAALAAAETDTDTTECAAEGDACTMDDGEAGTCDADLVCAADDGGGCNTSGAPVAGGLSLLSLGLMGLRRRRS